MRVCVCALHKLVHPCEYNLRETQMCVCVCVCVCVCACVCTGAFDLNNAEHGIQDLINDAVQPQFRQRLRIAWERGFEQQPNIRTTWEDSGSQMFTAAASLVRSTFNYRR